MYRTDIYSSQKDRHKFTYWKPFSYTQYLGTLFSTGKVSSNRLCKSNSTTEVCEIYSLMTKLVLGALKIRKCSTSRWNFNGANWWNTSSVL